MVFFDSKADDMYSKLVNQLDASKTSRQPIARAFDSSCGETRPPGGFRPHEPLCAFVQATVATRELVAESGCPLVTLCSELRKETGRLARRSAQLFAEPLAWMESQRTAASGGGIRQPGGHMYSQIA